MGALFKIKLRVPPNDARAVGCMALVDSSCRASVAKAALKGELVSVNSRSKAKTHRTSTAFVSTHTLGSLAPIRLYVITCGRCHDCLLPLGS